MKNYNHQINEDFIRKLLDCSKGYLSSETELTEENFQMKMLVSLDYSYDNRELSLSGEKAGNDYSDNLIGNLFESNIKSVVENWIDSSSINDFLIQMGIEKVFGESVYQEEFNLPLSSSIYADDEELLDFYSRTKNNIDLNDWTGKNSYELVNDAGPPYMEAFEGIDLFDTTCNPQVVYNFLDIGPFSDTSFWNKKYGIIFASYNDVNTKEKIISTLKILKKNDSILYYVTSPKSVHNIQEIIQNRKNLRENFYVDAIIELTNKSNIDDLVILIIRKENKSFKSKGKTLLLNLNKIDFKKTIKKYFELSTRILDGKTLNNDEKYFITTKQYTDERLKNYSSKDAPYYEILHNDNSRESKTSECKSSISLHTDGGQTKNKDHILELEGVIKTIAAFMNTDGGKLYIGVKDDGEIIGIEDEQIKFFNSKFDDYRKHIIRRCTTLLNGKTPEDIISHKFTSGSADGKTICIIECKTASKAVFVKIDTRISKDKNNKKGDGHPTYNEGDEIFYTRLPGETKKLSGNELVDYINQHWGTQ